MLYLVGLGLDDGEITEKGLEALESVDSAFAEFYTNTVNIDTERLEQKTGTEIQVLEREEVEREDRVLDAAEEEDAAFLVSGDPFTATTHYDIKERAGEKGIDVEVIHAPSILTSIAETGLNVYKFGRAVTLPEESAPESVVDYIEKNDSIGLHTLVLLDIDYPANQAAEKLVEMGVDPEREAVVIQRVNRQDQQISLKQLYDISEMNTGPTPHSIILVGETGHREREFVKRYK